LKEETENKDDEENDRQHILADGALKKNRARPPDFFKSHFGY